ncbi:DUF6387 family protein [Halomonas saccharevitans]|uniref:DUF6387 family protein n=1 Tax=Halomonas saccharevitans TaxID=416872 RepID=A0ABU3NI23_9GAMM|nr:DUF6387 family protein [Halomonas saccharevitans]MDT8880821.1 DUF6387 family protein [Halomonas saccharevitans]
MVKLIRKGEDLPKWFDINNYESWRGVSYYDAVKAVMIRVRIWEWFYGDESSFYSEEDGLYQSLIEDLSRLSCDPFRIEGNGLMVCTAPSARAVVQIGDIEDYKIDFRFPHLKSRYLAAAEIAGEVTGRSVAAKEGRSVKELTLLDVMDWLDENKEMVSRLEERVDDLSVKYQWNHGEARKEVFNNVFLSSDDASLLKFDGGVTIEAEVQALRSHLLEKQGGNRARARSRQSDVEKLFRYKVAAYYDLKLWSRFSGVSITGRCMASALFPDGRFYENDMQPSKTFGGFISKLEDGYISELFLKAAEM